MAIMLEQSARCSPVDWFALKATGVDVFTILLPRSLCSGNQGDGYYMSYEPWVWCLENLKNSWYTSISFKPAFETVDQEEAALFKLFWL